MNFIVTKSIDFKIRSTTCSNLYVTSSILNLFTSTKLQEIEVTQIKLFLYNDAINQLNEKESNKKKNERLTYIQLDSVLLVFGQSVQFFTITTFTYHKRILGLTQPKSISNPTDVIIEI